STPLANVTALTKLAKEGILVKGNKFIEQVNNIEVIAFDKTGTLTEGNLKVFDIYAFKGNKEEILRTAASLEILSEHPIGKAIVDQANKVNLSLYTIDKFEVLKGKGIMGKINGELFKVGNRRFFEDMNYKIPYEILENIKISGTIPIMLGNNSELLGIITIRDVLRISAPVLVKGLFKRGYDSFLISGDNQAVCDTIGACLDITESYGELLPDQKIEKIKALKKEYKGVAMVGDGINDAPALALSDLGIAIGASATDLTLETADVIIMNDDLTKLLTFIDIAKKTNKIIKQNIWSSIIIKITFAILTVIGLMTLWLAVGISDMGLSLAIMLNSMTIFRYKIKYSKVPSEKLESKARMIVCKTCQTKNILPQHHGRDMVQEGKKLVCWRKMLNNGFLEPCEEELPLNCPTCQNLLELK
ncbi:MAG: heavy metal translocating P-type ATPase, partial [Promethearchaeota archaeon]